MDDRVDFQQNLEIQGCETAFPEESHDTGLGNQGEYNESYITNITNIPNITNNITNNNDNYIASLS